MEKIDASPANSFTVDERLLPRSFMYIRKNLKQSPEEHQLVLVTMKILEH